MTRLRRVSLIAVPALVLAGMTAVTTSASAGTRPAAKAPAAAAVPLPASVADQAVVAAAAAAGVHTVTFVNNSGQTIWIGSTVNDDGSVNFTSLPTLAPGQSATITIPENASPNHWRGKFFARTGCTGTSGGTFHCLVADCGVYADHCTTGEQPASLAEFNFDQADALAPWYDVSHVNAFSLPITISPVNAGTVSGQCDTMGCSEDLLPYCPSAYVVTDGSGKRINCVNPNRDAPTDYSAMINQHCPKAYGWSKNDTVPGNQTMQNCTACSGFTVTFHGSGSTPPPATSTGYTVVGPGGTCVDVAGDDTGGNGAAVQLWDCQSYAKDQHWLLKNGTMQTLGRCLDIVGNATAGGAKLELWDCNGVGGQQWVTQADGSIRNPQSGRCIDAPNGATANGTRLQIWDCNGSGAQQFAYNNGATNLVGPGGTCVDVAGDDTGGDGAAVQLWACQPYARDQHWAWTGQALTTMGMCLDIAGGATTNGTKLQLHDCTGNAAQLWVPQTDGSMRNPGSGRCIDAPSGVTTNGTRLQIWDCNGSGAQKFAKA